MISFRRDTINRLVLNCTLFQYFSRTMNTAFVYVFLVFLMAQRSSAQSDLFGDSVEDLAPSTMSVRDEINLLCMVCSPIYALYLVSQTRVHNITLFAGIVSLVVTVGYWLVACYYNTISVTTVCASVSAIPSFVVCVFHVAESMRKKESVDEEDENEKEDEKENEKEDAKEDEKEDEDDDGGFSAMFFTELLTSLLIAALFESPETDSITELVVFKQD